MESSRNGLISFASACMEACRASRMRLFSSRYSKKTYTQRQHACVLLIMKRLKLHYRDATELLEVSPGLMGALGLSRVPHYTTLHKFFQRCGGFVLTVLLSHTARLSGGSGVIAIDATGFSSNYASRYYAMFRYRTQKGVWSASYIRNSAAVDLKSQAILATVCRNNHSHESVDFNMVLRKAVKTEDVSLVIADRGYDFERVHAFARDVMNVDTLIPVRKAIRNGKITGLYRRRMHRRSNWKAYGNRSRIEGVFSVMKRKFGDVAYSRSWIMQRKEMALICCAYNVHRYVVLSFFIRIEVFYKTV